MIAQLPASSEFSDEDKQHTPSSRMTHLCNLDNIPGVHTVPCDWSVCQGVRLDPLGSRIIYHAVKESSRLSEQQHSFNTRGSVIYCIAGKEGGTDKSRGCTKKRTL